MTDSEDNDNHHHNHKNRSVKTTKWDRRLQPIIWRKVLFFIAIHIGGFYGLYLFLLEGKWASLAWGYSVGLICGLGVTAGAHRLWAHKAYKEDVIKWCRDHRLHHKYTDTDADPSNAARGFFYSHIGWLCVKKHPEVLLKGKNIDLSDLVKDPVLYYQRKFYPILVLFWAMIFPAFVPYYFWGETVGISFFFCVVGRYGLNLHGTFLVNSAAHIWGNKPFNKGILPTECKIANFAQYGMGEGWHNYHHVFPWDYRASEMGWKMNITAMFIDGCAKIGLAYDLKTPSDELVAKQKLKHGDGTRADSNNN